MSGSSVLPSPSSLSSLSSRSSSPTLTISLLGAPRVERDGKPVEVDTRKAIALLAYLAVTRQPQNRDALALLLWPDYDQASARASLRRTLSALRKGLGEQEWVAVERDRISLSPGPGLDVDVWRFEHALAEEDRPESLEAAASLYRGDFLSGFTLRESPNFDDWQAFQADAFRRQLAAALERLVDGLSRRGAFSEALGHARRWLALDPLHEPAHRQVMLLHAWTGERAAALRQYRECVRLLDEELGVPPLSETTDLASAIKEGHAPAPPATPAPAASPAAPAVPAGARGVALEPPGGSPPAPLALVGRERELVMLENAYRSAPGHLAVIEGEAGIGKTRLAEELLARTRAAGAVTLVGRCYEGEVALAFAPFAAALRGGLGTPPDPVSRLAAVPAHWLAEAARLAPQLAALRPELPPPPPLEGAAAQTHFFEGLSHTLAALAGPRGVLFVDDAQWADAASLDLLAYLVRRLDTHPLFVVVTWREEDVPPDHRLRRLFAEAQRASRATHLRLGRLTPEEVACLAHASSAAGSPTSSPTVSAALAELHRLSEGLPFFVVEYLAARAGAPTDTALPSGVHGLLRSRLAAVGETAHQLLTTAAVIGRSFDFDTLREASGRAEAETVTALDELLTRRLIAESDSTFDFTHELLRRLVYDETSLVRRRLLHRRVAEALSARTRAARHTGADSADGQIARHFQAAGLDQQAAHHFRLAGERAARLYANAEALSHFRAALALGHPDAADLHESIGDLHTLSGQYAAAQASYELAAARCHPDSLAAVEHKLGNLYRRRGEWELAESHYAAAADSYPADDAASRGRLLADRSLVAHRRGETPRAIDLAQEALALAEAADDVRALAQAHNILGILAKRREDASTAIQHFEKSLALAEIAADPAARVAAMNNLALAATATGQHDRAHQLLTTALVACESVGDRHRAAALHNNLADLLQSAGRPEDAMAHLKRAVTLFAEIGADAPEAARAEIWKLSEW